MMRANGIQAILFDLDGTLRFNRPPGKDVFARRVAEIGIPLTAEDRQRAARWEHFYWAQSSEMLADIKAYEDEEAFWRNYSRRQLIALGCSTEQAQELAPELEAYMRDQYQPVDWIPAYTPALLDELKQAGYTLAVVSNRMKSFQEYLDDRGLGPYFEFTLAAGEVNSWKPEVEIFQHALSRLGVSAQASLYIGDNYFADVVGARTAGIRPVLIDPEQIFPDPGCPVIDSLDNLPSLLERI